VASRRWGFRVASLADPGGTQTTKPRRALVRRTLYLLRMNLRADALTTETQRVPTNLQVPQLPASGSNTISSPQHTPAQSSSSPWHSNSVATTSKDEDERTSSEARRNHSSYGYPCLNPEETSSP